MTETLPITLERFAFFSSPLLFLLKKPPLEFFRENSPELKMYGKSFGFMQADQNIISNITCFETFQTIGANILDDMICTLKGPLGTESICSGDSGSPLMVKEGWIIACQKGITYLYIENIDFPFNSFRWQQQQVYSGRFDLIFNG